MFEITNFLTYLLTAAVTYFNVLSSPKTDKKIAILYLHIVRLTLPPHIINKPWISRKNEKAIKIMIQTQILLWKTIIEGYVLGLGLGFFFVLN